MYNTEDVEPMEFEILENQEAIPFSLDDFPNLEEIEISLQEEEDALIRLEKYKKESQDQKLYRMEEMKRALQDDNILQALIQLQNKYRYEEKNEKIYVKYILPDRKRETVFNIIPALQRDYKNPSIPQFDLIQDGNNIYAKHLKYIQVNNNCYIWKEESGGIRKSQYELC
jgi:hypothetical protein